MTFCPEWLTGSPNLDTGNFLYLWVYLFVSYVALACPMNVLTYCVHYLYLQFMNVM